MNEPKAGEEGADAIVGEEGVVLVVEGTDPNIEDVANGLLGGLIRGEPNGGFTDRFSEDLVEAFSDRGDGLSGEDPRMGLVDDGDGMDDDKGTVRLAVVRERLTSLEDIVSPSSLL